MNMPYVIRRCNKITYAIIYRICNSVVAFVIDRDESGNLK